MDIIVTSFGLNALGLNAFVCVHAESIFAKPITYGIYVKKFDATANTFDEV